MQEEFLLTKSQEMHLLADSDVEIIMDNLLEQPELDDQKGFLYEDVLPQQWLESNEHHVQQEPYGNGVMPNLLPPVNTAHPQLPPLVNNEDYTGPFDFELYLSGQSRNKNPWVYSASLNKLFIAMATPFPIEFKCQWPGKKLFIRATPIFSLAQHSQDLVIRCVTHARPKDTSNLNMPNFVWNHVIRCQNSNATYHGSVDDNIRLSVVVPLEMPQMGSDHVRVLYTFMCKNSCPSGMNRKPFEVVFTLEDEIGQVFGRQILHARVCSCPKRDKEKEEKMFINKEGGSAVPPPGKKLKTNDKKSVPAGEYPVDTKEYPLPTRICGKHNQALVFQYCYSLMAADLLAHGDNEKIRKCVDNLLVEKRKMIE